MNTQLPNSSMKKLKIAFLSGGNFTHTLAYLDFFRDRGHTVYWITCDRTEKHYDIPLFDISFGAKGTMFSSKWKYLLAALSIRKVLRKIKPDILHGHYVTSAGLICLVSAFTPYVLTAHGSDLIDSMKSIIWKKILRYAFKKAALVNVVSEDLASLTRELGVPHEKVFVATVGVDTRVFTYQPKEDIQSPVRLLCTRSLESVYDPQTIINACEILRQRNISYTLTFAASGSLQIFLESMAVKKKLADIIIFLGGYNNTSLPTILHAHDIYISASLWDGTSICLLEAMACGIFPVVSRIKSNQTWLEENNSAFMFECGNAQELADKITCCIDNESLRSAGIQKNRLLVEKKGDRDKNMSVIEKCYYQLADIHQ